MYNAFLRTVLLLFLLFIVPMSLEVCDSRGLQFVAKICHKCSHPGAGDRTKSEKNRITSARQKSLVLPWFKEILVVYE